MGALDEYNAKRRFLRTPEPFGEMGETDPDALRFVVNHHLAKREHWDLRLEHGGVLWSWAIPEGPSLDPAHKRFAARTEDHPLAYLAFAGIIPPGEYGAGKLRVWDTGTWVPLDDNPAASHAAGEMKFRLIGNRLSGGFMLKRLSSGDDDWLLIKERDPSVEKGYQPEPATKRLTRLKRPGTAAPLPKSLKPMLPTLVDTPPMADGWLHEIKYDGYRTHLIKDGDTLRFRTRNGLDWTDRYGHLSVVAAHLDCDTAILDGEVAAQDARGATSLELLQAALSEGRTQDLIFYAFDLLYLDGLDMTDLPLTERKAWLRRAIPAEAGRLVYSDHVDGDGRALFSQANRLGLEGIVSKKADSAYRPGRTQSWLKAKRYDMGSFDVVGFVTKSSDRHVASLMLAEPTEDGLRYVGRAGTGLSLEEARAWFDRLTRLEISTPEVTVPRVQGAHHIPAGLVRAEITYRGRTGSNVLRQAAILSVTETAPATDARPRTLVTDRDLAAIRLTNPDREVFEGSGTTKLDIALYYARVGDLMLPHLLNRPVSMVRSPSGKLDDIFYQRHGFSGLPDGVDTVSGGEKEYLVVRTVRGFLGLPQFGVIEFHPWDCTTEDMDHPDRMTIDLDPGDVDWSVIVSGAEIVRDRLTALGLPSFVRMSGGKGLHVVVPLAATQTWKKVHGFLTAFARLLAKENPGLFVATMAKTARTGRIYLDIHRTGRGTSAVGSYSLRATPRFGVALPLAWSDLSAQLTPAQIDRKTALLHVERSAGREWADFDEARAPIEPRAFKGVGL